MGTRSEVRWVQSMGAGARMPGFYSALGWEHSKWAGGSPHLGSTQALQMGPGQGELQLLGGSGPWIPD